MFTSGSTRGKSMLTAAVSLARSPSRSSPSRVLVSIGRGINPANTGRRFPVVANIQAAAAAAGWTLATTGERRPRFPALLPGPVDVSTHEGYDLDDDLATGTPAVSMDDPLVEPDVRMPDVCDSARGVPCAVEVTDYGLSLGVDTFLALEDRTLSQKEIAFTDRLAARSALSYAVMAVKTEPARERADIRAMLGDVRRKRSKRIRSAALAKVRAARRSPPAWDLLALKGKWRGG